MSPFHPPVAPLFGPATRPDRFEKAAASGADAIIIDLEDAVPDDDKNAARAVIEAAELGKFKVPILLRVNGRGNSWHEDDLRLAGRLPLSGIMLPKTESPEDLQMVAQSVGDSLPVIALIETAVGVANLPQLACAGNVVQLAFGSIDFAVDIGAEHCREALSLARATIVLHSRVARLSAPLDGVTTSTDDRIQIASDSTYAASLGFGGKLAIHPMQIPIILPAFRPSAADIAWAREIDSIMKAGGGTARKVRAMMVDTPVLERARRILARI